MGNMPISITQKTLYVGEVYFFDSVTMLLKRGIGNVK